jgi:molybdopterin synthase catalytic subunit
MSKIDVTLHDGPVDAVTLDWPADCGAEVVFLGRTRGELHPEHGELVRLEYEVYESMALSLLSEMSHTAAERFDCHFVRAVHAQGIIHPGAASVVIQVACPHRGEAFDACRFLIDQIKRDLPVWKTEVWQNGETFVEDCRVQA